MKEEFSSAFGDRVKRILAEAHLTPDRVEALSEKRMSHMTVRRMTRGSVPNSDLIIEFVETVGRHLEWSLKDRQRAANDLLSLVQSRARYASVRHALAAY